MNSSRTNTEGISPDMSCALCGSRRVAPLYEVRDVPVFCNNLWAGREEAVACPRGDIELLFCRECGYIWNTAFDASRLEYTGSYDNSLHFSERFRGYAGSLAQRLIDRYDLRGKEIIEIGCGKGDFLVMLCRMGGNRGFGFDRSYVERGDVERADAERGDADRGGAEPHGPDVTFIRDHFSEKYSDCHADLVIARHVLEHVPDPGSFLRTIRPALGTRRGSALFVEVPNMLYTMRRLFVWDIIYEHYSYFIPDALAHLMAASGFDVNELSEEFEGQYLTAHAASRTDGGASISPHGGDERDGPDVEAFRDGCARLVGSWRSRIERIAADGRRVVVWGAGSKGVMFLNTVSPGDTIPFAVDINPAKEGMHVAGTGQRIVPPSFLERYIPDVIIVMNRIYEKEIRATVDGMGMAPEYLFV